LTTIVTAAVTGLVSLFAVRCVLGMGEGATLPAANRARSKWTGLAARGTAIGVTHAPGRVGAAAAAPLVVFLITWFSWRFSFVALGTLSVFWVALWWWKFYEDPRQHPVITSVELAELPAADPAILNGSGPVPWQRPVPRMTPMMIIYFCQGWTGWLYVT
jgi:MFS family permease